MVERRPRRGRDDHRGLVRRARAAQPPGRADIGRTGRFTSADAGPTGRATSTAPTGDCTSAAADPTTAGRSETASAPGATGADPRRQVRSSAPTADRAGAPRSGHPRRAQPPTARGATACP